MHADRQVSSLQSLETVHACHARSVAMCKILHFDVQRLVHVGYRQGQRGPCDFTGQLHRFSIPIRWRWCSTKYVQAAGIAACRTDASVSFAETCWLIRLNRKLNLRDPSAPCPLSKPL